MAQNDLSPLASFVIFIVIPLIAVAILAAFTLAPSWTRAGRYRPGEPWEHEPVMINGAYGGPVTDAEEIGGQITAEAEFGQIDYGQSEVRVGDDVVSVKVPSLDPEIPAVGGEGGISARW